MSVYFSANWGDRNELHYARTLADYHAYGVSWAEAVACLAQSLGYAAVAGEALSQVSGTATPGLAAVAGATLVLGAAAVAKLAAAATLRGKYEFLNVDYLLVFAYRSVSQEDLVANYLLHLLLAPVLPVVVTVLARRALKTRK